MYKSNRKYHDISLVRLDLPVEFNNKLFPACLWTDSNEDLLIQEKHTITVCGFGDTSIESECPQMLPPTPTKV
jgi:Trypsin